MTSFVFKAQPVGTEIVPDIDIRAVKSFPDLDDLAYARAQHDSDADLIVAELIARLPGGTVDALLRRLLEHRASLLRVRWPS